LLSLAAIPGESLTTHDIAAWCDCTPQAITNIERSAMVKLRNALRFGDRATWEELRASPSHGRRPARRVTQSLEQSVLLAA